MGGGGRESFNPPLGPLALQTIKSHLCQPPSPSHLPPPPPPSSLHHQNLGSVQEYSNGFWPAPNSLHRDSIKHIHPRNQHIARVIFHRLLSYLMTCLSATNLTCQNMEGCHVPISNMSARLLLVGSHAWMEGIKFLWQLPPPPLYQNCVACYCLNRLHTNLLHLATLRV